MSAPQPDAADRRDAGTFAALMWALARPGTVHRMPEPGLAPVALALVDGECRVHAADPALAAIIAGTGARAAPAAEADHVFAAAGAVPSPDRLCRGSALYPDDGATLVVEVQIGSGSALRLAGPGIETEARIAVEGLPAAFWSGRAAACRYPEGIDIFLIDGARVIGLPRSTTVEVA